MKTRRAEWEDTRRKDDRNEADFMAMHLPGEPGGDPRREVVSKWKTSSNPRECLGRSISAGPPPVFTGGASTNADPVRLLALSPVIRQLREPPWRLVAASGPLASLCLLMYPILPGAAFQALSRL